MNTAGKRASHPICPGLAHSQKKGTPMMLSKPDQTPPRLERTTLEKKYKERHDLEFPSKHRYIESNRIRKRVLWVVCVLFAAFSFQSSILLPKGSKTMASLSFSHWTPYMRENMVEWFLISLLRTTNCSLITSCPASPLYLYAIRRSSVIQQLRILLSLPS